MWHSARVYTRAYGIVKDRTGRNLKGFGFVLRRIKRDRVFTAFGMQWYFDHRIANAYLRMVAGEHNEPETHDLLKFLADNITTELTFIDVGASIGEMLMTMAVHPRVAHAIGFEPHPLSAEACRRHIALNDLRNVRIVEKVVGDGSSQRYVADYSKPTTSGVQRDGANGTHTATQRLDDILLDVSGPCIMLIDVEGAELDVMKGAHTFIHAHRPLIIFEYNDVTRRHFGLDAVKSLLGPAYNLFRLRVDGRLERSLDIIWNCVAVPNGTEFEDLCRQRIT